MKKILTLLSVVCLSHLSSDHTQAQVLITNSSVSYTYDASPETAFIPGTPATAASPDSTLAFFPTEAGGILSSGPWDIGTISGLISIGMQANPDHWFTGTALALSANISYSLAAPSSGSEAGIAVSFPYTVMVTGVDYAPFSTAVSAWTDSMSFSDPYIMINGPLNFQSGFITGSSALDIHTLKNHFGIGAGMNITGMVLQIAPSGTGWAEQGSVSGSLANFQINNQIEVVPEPSTYALVLLAGAAAVLLRRRRAAAKAV